MQDLKNQKATKCYNDYCIYQEDNLCILNDVEINNLGMCEHCEIVSFDKDVLDSAKKQRLNEIDEYWAAVDKIDKMDKNNVIKI